MSILKGFLQVRCANMYEAVFLWSSGGLGHACLCCEGVLGAGQYLVWLFGSYHFWGKAGNGAGVVGIIRPPHILKN